jgi:acylpyruvate hydrolase
MKLATFTVPGNSNPVGGEIRDGQAIEFGDGSTVLQRIESGNLSPATGTAHSIDSVELLAPIPKPPMIYGIGLNYRSHAKEIGAEPPAAPIVFPKAPSSSTRPSGPVVKPAVVRLLDYEAELAVVIGNDGGVFGYAVADDISSRDLQGTEPHWIRAKGSDTFCPWGPWITTADEIEDVESLVVRGFVNAEQRQEAPVSDLVHPIPVVLKFIQEAITLAAGDVILTGTPGGVGMAMDPRRFLEDGDVVRVEIDGLGSIEHSVKFA